MKIQETPNLIQASSRNRNSTWKNNQQVSFQGLETPFVQVLNFLNTNQAWGAIAIDASCMGIPRSTVDFTRGTDAGIETMRREFSSTINSSLIGVYGTLAGIALCQTFNNEFNVKANKMFIGNEVLDILTHDWNEAKTAKNPLENFLGKVISNIEGFSPEHKDSNTYGWVKLESESQKDVVSKLAKEIQEGPEQISKETMAYLKSVITSSVGSESKVKLEEKNIGGKIVKADSTLEGLLGNIYDVSKMLVKDEVASTFKGNLANNKFINGMKKLNARIAVLGLAVAVALGLATQPFNAYLTKRKTGKSGFVGIKGREDDKSLGFKLLKTGVAIAFGLGVIKTIGRFNAGELLRKVQFKGFTPSIDQFKLVYGMTIASRLFAARDKHELRESTFKDTLGFASWLILGGFVSKLTAAGIEKLSVFKNKNEIFIRYNKFENGESKFKWLTESNILTRNEVLHEAFKKAGKSTIKEINGKKVAMTFKEMLKELPNFDKMAQKKIRYLGLIQFAGYLYSGIALGIGIPKLNIAITKHFQKKHESEQ